MEHEFNDDILYKEVDTWHWYDKMLFKLYHETGHSIRKIAKMTQISTTSIFKTLKLCQVKINKRFGVNYQEYRKQKKNR